jgi:hypothetical protein
MSEKIIEVPPTLTDDPNIVRLGPAIDLSVTPAETLLPVTVQVAETTHANGDMLDNMSWLKHLPIDGVVMRLGSIAAGLSYGTFFLREGYEGHVALTASVLAVTEAAKQVSRVHQRHKYAKQTDTLHYMQQETGLPVEIFRRRRDKALDMRMYVSDEPVTTAQLAKELHLLTEAADAGQIDNVTLPLSRVVDFVDQDAIDASQTQSEWLKSIKGSRLKDKKIHDAESFLSEDQHGESTTYDEQYLLTLSVPELQDLLDKVTVASSNEPLDTIMRLLTHVQPNHPALKDYALLQKHPNASRDTLKRTLTMAIERRLDDVFAERKEYPISKTVIKPDGTPEAIDLKIPVKVKGALSGTPRVGKDGQALVEWRAANTNLLQHDSGLLEDKKLSEQRLVELLKAADQLPKEQVIELCELAAWLSLEGLLPADFEQDQAAQTSWHEHLELESSGMPGLQERTAGFLYGRRKERKAAEIELTRGRRLTRFSKTAAIIGLMGGLSMYSASTLMDVAVTAGDRAQHELEKRGIDFPSATQIDAQRRRDNPWVSGWLDATDLEDKYWYEPIGNLSRHLGIDPFHLSDVDFNVSTEAKGNMSGNWDDLRQSNVGNVSAGGDNVPAWWITSINGMPSEGYWPQDVYDYLASDDLSWLQESDGLGDGASWHELTSPDKLDKSQPMLKVVAPTVSWSTIFSPADVFPGVDKTDPHGRYMLIGVPVLEGTRIVAAETSDKKAIIKLVVDATGQQKLAINSDEGVKDLKFWLTEDKSAPKPHRIKQFAAEKPINKEQVARAWAEYLGEPIPPDPKKALEVEQQAIASKFRYSLDPITRLGALQNTDRFIHTVFAAQKANCNVANTLLAVSNPRLVAPITGFLNSNDKEQLENGTMYLSAHEAHLWTVDDRGDRHDATPSGGDAGSDFFAEEFHNQQPHESVMQKRLEQTMRFLKFGASILVVEEIIRRRKRIAARAGSAYGKAVLVGVGDRALVAADRGIDYALFGPDSSSAIIDPSGLIAPMDSAYRGSDRASNITPDEARESLRAKASSWTSIPKPVVTDDPVLRRDVRRARRIIRAMQRSTNKVSG